MLKKQSLLRSLAAAAAAIAVFVSGIAGVSATSTGTQSGAHTNIVGGQPAPQSYTVSLQSIDASGPHHECGGVLVARNWVLTAAHCAPFVTGQARVGSVNWKQGGETAAVGHIFVSPSYDPTKGFGNDIALVQLKTNVSAKPVSVGIFGPPNAPGLAQGWGLTCDTDLNAPDCLAQRPDLLQQLAMSRATTDHFCDLEDSTGLQLNDTNTMMCLVTTDGSPAGACFGDSGSPFLETRHGKQVATGIMVAIMNNTQRTPHACSRTPDGGPNRDAATKIASQVPWIFQTLWENDPVAAQFFVANSVVI